MKTWIAGVLAIAALGAAFATAMPLADGARRPAREATLAETLLLLRWGHGALGTPHTDDDTRRASHEHP